uniref:WPP domain-interacting n=1 Tax=Saccharum hybrid cultivar SP80-3280 TaxID=193079 RepID=A0A2R4QNI9_9POAL|nr:WPP domain-interacting [Saccharum hybrid cultivar SP80-3280]
MDFHSIDDYFHENSLTQGSEGVAGASTEAILERVYHDIAFGSEKLLNLDMLVMEIARRASDIEPLMRDPRSISAELVDKAFEFDVLHSIVDSEVSELENLAVSIQTDIGDAETKAFGEEPGSRVTDKLCTRKESLKQMQDVISDIRTQLATFEKAIQPSHGKQGNSEGMGYENGHMSGHTAMQAEDQRNVLQMLQQSIASKLDLENKLCDSQSVVEGLKMKLHHAEQESCFLEESMKELYERMFSAENASQLFLGTLKELLGKLDTTQFYLSASIHREGDLKSKLEENLMKLSANKSTREIVLGDSDNDASQEPVQMQVLPPPEFLTLWNKVQQLEELLRDSGSQLQQSSLSRGATEEEQDTVQSEISTFGNIINDLKLAISNAESRTQNAETRCTQLTQTNVQLNGELNSLKSQGSDRAGLLETKLKESDTQLEHARASVDAIVEQQGMLRLSMSDMEHVIEDLKEKYSKAETRAESAESKCSLLTDTNLELSEELSFLRGRVESLENSLHEANQLKVSSAKDIASKTKTIMDLVAKLALERERLHVQIVTLTKKNRMLAQKCKENVSERILLCKNVTTTEGELRPSQAKRAGNTPQEEVEADEVIPVEDESGAGSAPETVRSIEPTMLNWKYISAAVLALLAAVVVYYYQSDDGVQQLLRQFVG